MKHSVEEVSKKYGNFPRTILMISPSFSPISGGLETHLNDLCEYLRKRNYRIYIITYSFLEKRAKTISGSNPKVYRIPWFSYNLLLKLEPYPPLYFVYLVPMLLLASLLFMLKHKHEVDVIHAHGLAAAVVARSLMKVFNKKAVVSLHTIYGLRKRPILSKIATRILSPFDTVLTLSMRSGKELVNAGLNNVKVFTYWVNQKSFAPLNKALCKRKLGLEGKFVILFVGRLIEVKGVKILLRIARELRDYNDIHFAYVGTGPLSKEVIKVSKNLGNITYFGEVKNENLSVYYNAANLLVAPSLHEEGFGRVVLEALSCGTPVIASNVGGLSEALDPSVGILIDPRVDAIKDAILKLYNDRGKLEVLSKNCKEYAERRFSERNAKLIEESYL